MATKSYSKHKEYKEFKSNAPAPYTDEQFDMLKSELIPKGSKLEALARSSGGAGSREYHYEYKEEKLPAGKYDRKDLRTVEEYTIPAQTVPKAESASYYYEREERELPAITNGTRTYNYESSTSSTPGYSRIKSSKATKELSHNVEELDSLLDDLQKDQERQLYKSGYTSDTAESTSFDYRRGTPVKAPSSGYSTLKKEERVETSSWGGSPPPPLARTAELRQEMYREEKTESRVVPAPAPAPAPAPHAVSPLPPAVCTNCHTHTASSTGTLTRSSTPMNKVTTTVKTYTYEIPADVDPVTIATPPLQKTTTVTGVTSAPGGGCQYCSHCNSTIREYTHVSTKDEHTNERVVYPTAANETRHVRSVSPARPPAPVDQRDGHTPYGPSTYKYSETTYSSQNTTERFPLNSSVAQLPPPAPFPRPATPNPGQQQPPKRLDDLMADFPEARFPTEPDGLHHRKVEVTHERSTATSGSNGTKPAPPVGTSKNIAGPAVYYPPGHTPFQNKEVAGYQASSMQGGGAYASGRGMYEYESGSKSKEKHSEKKTAVPICLPLCCAMPCVIM